MSDGEAKLRPIFHFPAKERNIAWPAYTMEEVARHDKKDDCWIVVNDKVYDMTKHVSLAATIARKHSSSYLHHT